MVRRPRTSYARADVEQVPKKSLSFSASLCCTWKITPQSHYPLRRNQRVTVVNHTLHFTREGESILYGTPDSSDLL